MRSLFIAVCLFAICGGALAQAIPPADGVWKFDFGTAASPVAAGWIGVRPDTAYSAEQKFGLLPDKGLRRLPIDQNRRSYGNTLQLDDVTRDCIYGIGTFQLDLPNGKYQVIVLTGEYNRDGTNRPDSHYRPYAIKANGVTIYEQAGTEDDFYKPDGRYFSSYRHDWHPGFNPFETYLKPYLPIAEGTVEVTDGKLLLDGTKYYGVVNALIVYPVGSPAGQQAVADFRAQQESFFNKQFPYVADTPEHPMPSLPADVVSSGAAVYVRDDALAIRPGTRPVPRDFGRPLRLFAAQGERQAGVVAVTPLKDVNGQITFKATDLTGPGGARLPASALDIRYLKYTEYPVAEGYEVHPFWLVPWQPTAWEKDITRGFWVDLFTPENAAPGLYEGKLLLTGPGLNATLPLQVRVLPFKLPMSKLRAGVYASNVDSTTLRAFNLGQPWKPDSLAARITATRMKFFADQGFTGLFDSLPWGPVKLEGDKLVPTPAWESWKAFFAMAKTFPAFRDEVWSYYLGGPQFFGYCCPHFLSLPNAMKLELDDIKFSDEAVAEMTRACQWLYGELRASGAPELIFYVGDELGNDGVKGARYGRELLKALNKVKAQVPGGFTTCISTLGIADAREYMNLLDITIPNSGFPITKETLAEIKQSGSKLGLYNIGATRFSYGYYPWRVGALARAQWSFTYDGDTADPYGALPFGARVSCDCKYTPEWEVLPSIGMLVQRQGVNDYRYIQLLEEKLTAAEKAGKGQSAACKDGRTVLKELREAIQETYLDPANNWDTSTMDYYRWRIARAIMAL